MTQDGLPLIGAIPGLEGAYVATGHSVWGTAPATGEAMAELIVDGVARTVDLAPFDPADCLRSIRKGCAPRGDRIVRRASVPMAGALPCPKFCNSPPTVDAEQSAFAGAALSQCRLGCGERSGRHLRGTVPAQLATAMAQRRLSLPSLSHHRP